MLSLLRVFLYTIGLIHARPDWIKVVRSVVRLMINAIIKLLAVNKFSRSANSISDFRRVRVLEKFPIPGYAINRFRFSAIDDI